MRKKLWNQVLKMGLVFTSFHTKKSVFFVFEMTRKHVSLLQCKNRQKHFHACFWSWRNVQNQLKKLSRVNLNIKLNLNLHLNQSTSKISFSREIDLIPQVVKMSIFLFGYKVGSTSSAGTTMFCVESIIAGLLSSSSRFSVVIFVS